MEEIKMSDLLEVMPEDYYSETLKPMLEDIQLTCKFDPELNRTIEKTINIANQQAARKNYPELQAAFDVLAITLTDKHYLKSNLYIKAEQQEKTALKDLVQTIQELVMIIKCTKPEAVSSDETGRQRIGYNSEKKENDTLSKNTTGKLRERVPN
jgi:hypothetical protein